MRTPLDKNICVLCKKKMLHWKEIIHCPIIEQNTREEREKIQTILNTHQIKSNIDEMMMDINQ